MVQIKPKESWATVKFRLTGYAFDNYNLYSNICLPGALQIAEMTKPLPWRVTDSTTNEVPKAIQARGFITNYKSKYT